MNSKKYKTKEFCLSAAFKEALKKKTGSVLMRGSREDTVCGQKRFRGCKSAEKPLVSIVTGTYNSSGTVSKAIESVLNQTYDRIEYIIADGQSSDDTLAVAESYRERFSERGFEYIILSSRDTGIYAGMNKGIAAAHGELVGIVNSDDYYEPDTVQTAAREYEKTGYDLFYADINIVDGKGRRVRGKKSRRMKYYFTTRFWNHPATFIPKRIYDIRRYDESFQYYGDWELMLWIFRNFDNIDVVNKPLSNYRLGEPRIRAMIP